MFSPFNKKASAVIGIILCLFSSAFAYSGGNGTGADPYQIATVSDWQQLMSTSSHWGKYFIMTADVNLQGIILTPVGNSIYEFVGVFNGNSHIICNAVINQPDSNGVGLFGYLGPSSQINNLSIVDANITGRDHVGGLVGENYHGTLSNCYAADAVSGGSAVGGLVGENSNGAISNCYATGAVTGSGSCVGGLVGLMNSNYSDAAITNCYATGAVTGSDSYVGGLVGLVVHSAFNYNIIISNCYATGPVTGSGGYVGGLVGENNGKITNCRATGVVTGGGNYVGGLVGYNQHYYSIISTCYATGAVSGNRYWVGGLTGKNGGTITNCYATGVVSGRDGYVGGLVGENEGTISTCYATGNCYATGAISGNCVGGLVGENQGTISNCYATGLASGNRHIGGLAGYNYGTISNCYAAGAVTGSGNYIGGLVGYNDYGTISACFWDIEASGQTNSSGGMGLSTSQMKSVITYQNAGWANKGWVINDGLDYPHLAWENTGGAPIPEPQPAPLSGSGTEEDPYQVWTADDFALLSWYVSVLDKHIALMADLDLSGIILYPIGDSLRPFTGVFNGNGHIISNAIISQPDSGYVGLFGCLGLGLRCQINNLSVVDANITGSDHVGCLAGCNYGGTISDCYTTGIVSGDGYIGSLVGENRYHGTISNCYCTGTVSGFGDIGGLVGENEGTISNCYATGAVTGGGVENINIGGLVGENSNGAISNCYATGAVSGGIWSAGGLVGGNYRYGRITNCYATGTVSGIWEVGGLVGSNYDYSEITNCYATGAASGSSAVGGLVGYNIGEISWESTITNCYATGAVTVARTEYYDYDTCDTGAAGGLVGVNYYRGAITNCYATGAVTATGDSISDIGGLVGVNHKSTITNCYATGAVSGSGNIHVGGLVGYNNYDYDTGTIIASFWDIETSGQTTSDGGMGKTTAEMKTRSTFTSAGWDFVGETANGTEDIWTICEGVNYPKFTWQNHQPIANAGQDQTIYAWTDGIAEVELDGSDSSDADGCNGLTYHWSWTVDGNNCEANGVNPTIELPVGLHTIQLIVNDGLADSVPDDVNITVVAPLKGMLNITPSVINRNSCGHHRPENILALIRLPAGITKEDISNEPLVLYPSQIEASSQRIISVPYGFGRNKKWLVSIFAFFDMADVLDAIPTNGRVELKVAGELTSGRYFYGSDTVMIIGPKRPCHLSKK
jgi:hypothetical protein